MSLGKKLLTLSEQAQAISREMNEIGKERPKYEGCVLVYRGKGRSKDIPDTALIYSVDFASGFIHVKTPYGNNTSSLSISQIDFEVIPKEELAKYLK